MRLNQTPMLYYLMQQHIVVYVLLLLFGMVGCANHKKSNQADAVCLDKQQANRQDLPQEAFKNADDLLMVDCLLPGELIMIGMQQQWMTPPRPAIISAWQCKVQGGQFSLSRNVDGRTLALNVWKQCAAQGDKIAQNYMGEIYSKSWGTISADYVKAAKWYHLAAEQGYTRALNNLAFLYERGLGVIKNKSLAVQLYRQAMGSIETVKLDPLAKGKINALENKLGQALQTSHILENQLSDSENIAQQQQIKINALKQIQGNVSDIQAQLRAVRNQLAETNRREKNLKKKISDMQPEFKILRSQLEKTETTIAIKEIPNMEIGDYYALIIGVNQYQLPLESLQTPVNDAKQVEQVLRERYGFKTTLLVDDGAIKPTRSAIITALVKLSRKIRQKDNLLIYFAGHGDLRSNRAHWLPQNARFGNPAEWLSTDDITKEVELRTTGNGMKARHVLIIADSCYSAAMAKSWIDPAEKVFLASIPEEVVTRSSNTSLVFSKTTASELAIQPAGLPAEKRVGWIKARFEKNSRKILTSGGFEPVIDQESKNGLSIFANAFTNVLKDNKGIIGAKEVFENVGPLVVDEVKKRGMKQTPVYERIAGAGGSFGEFFFIAKP